MTAVIREPDQNEPPATFSWDTQPWAEDALCTQTDPESFFPEKGGSTREAKSVCTRCTVAAECLDYALACEDLDPYGGHGVWAGLTGKERNNLRRTLKDTA